MLDKERNNKEIQIIPRNLQDHALGDRLQGIKELLPSFWQHLAKSRLPQTVTAVSSLSGMENYPMSERPTPFSDALEPVRKRKRK